MEIYSKINAYSAKKRTQTVGFKNIQTNKTK